MVRKGSRVQVSKVAPFIGHYSMQKKLFRSTADKKLAGVCAGLAEYFDIDATLVRVGFVLLALLGGFPGILTYVVLWFVIPEKPHDGSRSPIDT